MMSTGSMHPAALDEDGLLKQCAVYHGRTSGPGGQHRNKVETATRIVHTPTGVVGQASERRSQRQNHEKAVFRLRVNLAVEHRMIVAGPMRSPTPLEASELWRSRVRKGRIACSAEHADFPAMLAEALDMLAAVDHDMSSACVLLDCSTSQLVKFIKKEPRAKAWVDLEREARGMKQLR